MTIPDHKSRAEAVLSRLAGWGFPDEVQSRIGSFGILWGVFEAGLETALWALNGEVAKGVRPSTDKNSISAWIAEWPKAAICLDTAGQEVVRVSAEAATDLMNYRHALFHGWMIPSESMPVFIRNPSWNGEVRKRPVSEAHVDVNLLDMAVSSAWTLCRVVDESRRSGKARTATPELLKMLSDARSAKSMANELAHLSVLMNHEKY